MTTAPSRTTKPPMGLRLAGLGLALLALLCAVFHAETVAFFGFPDNHVTDLEKAIALPIQIIAGIQALCAPYFLWFALRPVQSRASYPRLAAGVLLLVLSSIAGDFALPWYLEYVVGLDNGKGG